MTDDELYNLVRDNYNKVNRDYLLEQTAKACEYCPNNPRNGGSGVCHCLLGTPVMEVMPVQTPTFRDDCFVQ